ncbi:MAG: glycine cleavage T C-terminal barrel domain-containing protein [Halobacteriales archaeon]|nr:glycine cleavage T C-terminal barrel domain-containing protein [Halobacteriales archaeon]
MTDLESFHAEYGATFTEVGGRRVPADYGRPERTHRAVRNGVGVTERPVDVVVVTGDDRVDYVDNVVSNRVPREAGHGRYALLCDPNGRIETDLYVVNAGERLLLFLPAGRGAPTVDGWEAFIQDVAFEVATDRFAVFGVHGPQATPKVATVLAGAPPPDERLSFARGEIGDAGVSVLRTDAPAGETGYDVVCAAADAVDVLDALVTAGPSTPPFGRTVWEALTLEAGTPLFGTELEGRIPNVAGARAAVDFEKGCFVGQEVVSKVENVGRPSRRLIGLTLEGPPAAGAAVLADGDEVGEVTRGAESPTLGSAVAMAYVEFGLDPGVALAVDADGGALEATRAELPLVDGSERSGRLPQYPDRRPS